jgi:hypothetical protein
VADASRYEEDPHAADEIVRLCGRTLDDVLPAIARDAQRYVPILTGYLRAHIGHDKVTPTHGRVYANTEYAAAVERGHTHRNGGHVPGQPYLRPALYKNRNGS